jgi:hypothetical protein
VDLRDYDYIKITEVTEDNTALSEKPDYKKVEELVMEINAGVINAKDEL